MAKGRQKWANKAQVFLSVLGYIIGLGNIWRFPYMVYENGGGAFLIPYVLCAVLIAFPIFFLETAIGQFMKRGAFDCFNLAPIMKGVGLGTILIAVYLNLYYISILAWAIVYFYHSITSWTLPWTTCDNWWNTQNCVTSDGIPATQVNTSTNADLPAVSNVSSVPVPSVVEYWDNYVLRRSSGLEEMGTIDNWPLLISFFIAWVICFFCTFKGVKSTGKVIYFTATFPYLVLCILLVKGCTMPGAIDGVIYYLKPDITKLADPQVWVDAAGQVVFSYGVCFATIVAFASFNDFHHDCFKHAAVLAVCCSTTSLLSGFAIFTVIGGMAHEQNVSVESLPLSGPGLAFQAYPAALSTMPLPNLWNALFFLMLFTVGLDSQFTTMEGVVVAIIDKWPNYFGKKYRREALVGSLCLIFFVAGLPFVTKGGIYLFQLFNFYAVSGIALLTIATLQTLAISHVYGADRFCEDVELMIGYKPPRYFSICIKYIAPLLTAGIVIFYFAKYAPLTIDGYVYKDWVQAVGWVLCMSSIACVPSYAIFRVWRTEGNRIREKIREACRPIYTNHITRIRSEKGLLDDTEVAATEFSTGKNSDSTIKISS